MSEASSSSAAAPAAAAAAPKSMEIDIPMEDGEPLGATPNDKLIITKVQPGTLAEGKLKIGDQVMKVNGNPISDVNSFFKQLRFAPPCARLSIVRDDAKAEELQARVHIPEERAKLIQRRDGYSYFIAKLHWKANGPKLGLGIKHFQNRVLVSRCDANSLASLELKVGDHMLDIDGVPVTDKDVARDMLIKALQEKAQVSTLVERPETMEAKHWTQQALATNNAQPPSVHMNVDARAICAREKDRLKTKIPPPTSIIDTKRTPVGNCSFEEQVQVFQIQSDNVGRALRAVKK